MFKGISSIFRSSRSFSTAVSYSKYGTPKDVLRLENIAVSKELKANEVAVKMLAAPINHADLNMVEGVYGVKTTFPAVGGNEGVGVITTLGSGVSSLAVGDWVIPKTPNFGTWRKEVVAAADSVLKIPNDIHPAYAATLSVNPCTAYRLLRDFVALKPGDVIIQNGANSMVGLAVIQMAREMGVTTINVTRSDRPDVEKVWRIMGNLGGDVNIDETYLNTAQFNDILATLPPIKLALNCVGGDVVGQMARALGNNGTIVSYGGLSKQPISIPPEILAYKNLKLNGFWITEWNARHTDAERSAMLTEVVNMIRDEKLSFFFEMHDFDDFEYALQSRVEPFKFRNVVLNIDHPDRLAEHDALPDEEYKVFDSHSNLN